MFRVKSLELGFQSKDAKFCVLKKLCHWLNAESKISELDSESHLFVEKFFSNRFQTILFTFYFLLSTFYAFGQIQTKLTPEEILIGDTASLQITVTFDAQKMVTLPQIGDSLNKYIEITGQKIDTLKVGKGVNYVQNLTLTSFEPGEFLVNALPVIIDGDTLQTKAYQLKVLGLEVDQNSDKIFPIKSIMEQEITFWDKYKKYFWYFIIALILFFVIGLIIWMYLKERKKKKYMSKPLLPPYEEAMENLKILDKAKYLKNKKYYEYYSDLSFILKRYFGRRFEFPAQALLSDDLSNVMLEKDYIHSQEEADKLTEFLKDSDLAKYARSVPAEDKHLKYRRWIEDLIHKTRPLLEDSLPEHIKIEEKEKLRDIDNN